MLTDDKITELAKPFMSSTCDPYVFDDVIPECNIKEFTRAIEKEVVNVLTEPDVLIELIEPDVLIELDELESEILDLRDKIKRMNIQMQFRSQAWLVEKNKLRCQVIKLEDKITELEHDLADLEIETGNHQVMIKLNEEEE